MRPAGTRERVYARDGHCCVACGATERLTLDHRIPRSRGGADTEENLQVMCFRCNQAKGNRMPGEAKPTPAARKPRREPVVIRMADAHPRLRALLSA